MSGQVARRVSLVSFIIPAWNEEAMLPGTLQALKTAARVLPVPCEVLVVDDSSTDATAAIARAHGARVVPAHCRQIAATRNTGGREAKGDLLIFVDADTRVTPEVLAATLQAVEQGTVGGGCAVRFDKPMPPLARIAVPAFVGLYRWVGLAAGCYVFCTREAFVQTGGFDERLFASEECVFSLALKRVGRFVVLRQHVLTSSRKLRTFSFREYVTTIAHFALRGRSSLRRREGLDIWYGQRRPDPNHEAS